MEARGKVKKIGPKKIQQVWRKKEPQQPQVSGKINNSLKMGGKEKKGRKNVKQVWRKKKPPPSPSPPWVDLPLDVTANILHRLSLFQLMLVAERVCTTWRQVCIDPSFWQVNYMRGVGYTPDSDEMCARSTIIGIPYTLYPDPKVLEYTDPMWVNLDIY